jgi:AraC-like DNA-binding protein/quercetin dioxygenase-like cupin family protein
MKPQLLKITHEPVNSFSVRQDMVPNINNRWHYHQEIELIHFHKGSGTQFIGDSIKKFNPGDVVLLGANLPHYWMFDDEYLTNEFSDVVYSTVIHFQENFLGEQFLHLPECKPIKQILETAKRGIVVLKEHALGLGRLIDHIHDVQGISRITNLIECLSAIAGHPDLVKLSSLGFRYHEHDQESQRLNLVYNYTLKNFRNKIELKQIALISGLIPSSFCRYFRSKTGKTYNQFLIDIRVGYACKLLLDNTQSIKQICFESGFNNFSCFHKYFKSITGFTPQVYQERYTNSTRKKTAV